MSVAKTVTSSAVTESDKLAKLRKQYGCGPVELTGADDALYERHLFFDNVIGPTSRRPTRTVRGLCSLRARHSLATLGAHRGNIPARESQARLLPFDGVSHRPLAGQQRDESLARSSSRQASRDKQKNLDWLGTARTGARRRPGQRGAGTPGGLLPRLDGHDATPGDGLRPALRIRHLPADHPGRLATRAAGQLAPPAGPLGDRPTAASRWKSSWIARSRCAAALCSVVQASRRG